MSSSQTKFDFSKPESWTLDDCQVIKLQLVAERQQLSAHAMKLKVASEQLVGRSDVFRLEKTALEQEKAVLVEEIRQLTTEITSLKAQLEQEQFLNSLITPQSIALAKQTDELDLLRVEKAEMVEKCESLEAEKQSLQTKCDGFEAEKKDWETKYKSLEIEHAVVQVKYDGFSAKNVTLQKENDILRREYLRQQQEMARIKEQTARFSTGGLATIGIKPEGDCCDNLPQCRRNHSLKLVSTYGGHICDVCRCSLPSTVKHWRCSEWCDWDTCEGCYNKLLADKIAEEKKITAVEKTAEETAEKAAEKAAESAYVTGTTTTTTTPETIISPETPEKKKLCPRSHTLKPGSPYNRWFTCDGCKQHIAMGTSIESCRPCNFDLCTVCATK